MSIVRKAAALMRRFGGGVGTPTLDVQRLARAVAGPGIDTRLWFSAGTVGVLEEGGSFTTKDREAVFVDRLGAVVSVRLEPLGKVVNARVGGFTGRFGFALFPLRPGDEVVVGIPDGDLNSDAIAVVGTLPNQTAQVPADWNNDRVLFKLNVPFEVDAPAVKIRSPNLDLNGRKVNHSPEEI